MAWSSSRDGDLACAHPQTGQRLSPHNAGDCTPSTAAPLLFIDQDVAMFDPVSGEAALCAKLEEIAGMVRDGVRSLEASRARRNVP